VQIVRGPRRGQIWLVRLDPTEGHEINKTRLVLIIQNDLGNKLHSTTIIAPITSQHLDHVEPYQVNMTKHSTGLIKPSKALLDQVKTIDKRRLVKYLGKIDEFGQQNVDDAIKLSLGLD
jgi:mRNA interferase MazF